MDVAKSMDATEQGGGEEVEAGDQDTTLNSVDETVEESMTDMKLDDDADSNEDHVFAKNTEPDEEWTYCIEVYPWNIDDVGEKFVKLMRFSPFSRLTMKKKPHVKEEPVNDTEEKTDSDGKKPDTKPVINNRERVGCLQVYVNSTRAANAVLRSFTWRSMTAKRLKVEITKRNSDDDTVETAYMDLETYELCKCRSITKPTGDLTYRMAKVSNIPGDLTQEFLSVVLSRAILQNRMVAGEPKEKKDLTAEPVKKLEEIENFDGTFEFDCLSRGRCRAFVLAHKTVIINGTKISIEATNEETMVAQADGNRATNENAAKQQKQQKQNKAMTPNGKSPAVSRGAARGGARGAGRGGTRGAVRGGAGATRGAARGGAGGYSARGRGNGPLLSLVPRPASAGSYLRNGPAMPIPMTGRQKMNVKQRRGLMDQDMGRERSVGDSFRNEIDSLHSQLQESTRALEARLAMLNSERSYYEDDMGRGDMMGRADMMSRDMMSRDIMSRDMMSRDMGGAGVGAYPADPIQWRPPRDDFADYRGGYADRGAHLDFDMHQAGRFDDDLFPSNPFGKTRGRGGGGSGGGGRGGRGARRGAWS